MSDTVTMATQEPASAALAPVMTVRDLTLDRNNTPIAHIPDFQIAAGEAVALVGGSGSGKTTALMAMAGIRAPANGTVTINGVDPWTLPTATRDQFRSHCIGLVFQSFYLIDALTVAANVRLPARCASRWIDSRVAACVDDRAFDERERLRTLLDKLGIADIAKSRADRISHGQAQRVAVARALFNRPLVVLADEPTSALDDGNAAALLDLLKTSAISEGAALLIASHDRRVLDAVDQVVEVEQLQTG